MAALIFSSDGKLLLGQTDPAAGSVYMGTWIIPGGGVEPGETKLEALKRELMEEIGLDIADLDVRLVDDSATGSSEKTLRDSGERVMVAMNFFDYEIHLATTAELSAVTTSEELVKLHWVERADLAKTALSPPTIELLKKLGYMS